ncbi:hypothetical protein FVF58_06000 [Paraburkholderia panacisoli]|uniref:Uncharacterized protein n=1 Tax=Paraburkholderia panacisoli TaxID=2603818 RepID=A0A5B0HGM5_9BURK|nr:hypothetical protein [Paraburkholderia panacisoli]KAA1014405.1 hypothetical protein FVF58_06000 [Paraburkholderia panacisoli]
MQSLDRELSGGGASSISVTGVQVKSLVGRNEERVSTVATTGPFCIVNAAKNDRYFSGQSVPTIVPLSMLP